MPAGILSNGDPEMLAVAVKSAGFDGPAGSTCSACTPCSATRPTPPPTRWARQAFGLPAREILFVSSNGWDAIGATWFGYTTLWVNRSGAPLEQLGTEPTRTGRSLRDVLDFLSARPRLPHVRPHRLKRHDPLRRTP